MIGSHISDKNNENKSVQWKGLGCTVLQTYFKNFLALFFIFSFGKHMVVVFSIADKPGP